MNIKTKKRLVVAGCLVLCAVMIGLIGKSFMREPVTDTPLAAPDSAAGDVTVKPQAAPAGASEETGLPDSSAVYPDTRKPADADTAGRGAVSAGTEQTIQPDVTKPEYDEDALTDPSQTPDGTPVIGPPAPVDHDSVVTPPPEDRPSGAGSSGGLPGFDNVPDMGPNQGETLDDMYENGNKIGIMD